MKLENMFDLSGKVCIVTGGAGYIGSRFTKALLAFGAFVAATDIREIDKKELSDSDRLFTEICDVSSSESISACFKAVNKKFGHIDVLVNCANYGAGYGKGSQIEFMEDEVWNKGVDGTAGTVFRCTREIIPYLKENGGSIINIASMYGIVSPDPGIYGDNPQKNPPNYGAGKAAIVQFTRYSAAHLADYGIRVNSITPGPYPNPNNQSDPEFIKKLSRKTMLNRFGQPEELCGALVLLASDASTFMTGSNITVDGGWTAW